MIAVDTNVLVRYVTRDDPVQEQRARRLLQDNDILVSVTVLLETEWVLRRVYKLHRSTIDRIFTMLMSTERTTVEQDVRVMAAMEAFRAGMDFADALHLAGCPTPAFATFDADLAKQASTHFDLPAVITP
jgi:predicted nucleic-acid-binding protein